MNLNWSSNYTFDYLSSSPLNTVRTETQGDQFSGTSTDSFSKAIAPSKITVNVITVAKTGLFIEILDNINLSNQYLICI